MVLVHVKYGEASTPAVFGDCDSATLLDYARRRAVRHGGLRAAGRRARVGLSWPAAPAPARANAADRMPRSLEGEVDAEDEAAVAERAEATAAAEAAASIRALECTYEAGCGRPWKDALIGGVGLFKACQMPSTSRRRAARR